MATTPSISGSNLAEPWTLVKLLSALRSGDPALIHPFLAELGKDKRSSIEHGMDTGAAALHLAIRCGSVDTVALLLGHRAISPNGVHPFASGTSALHLAASLGRSDIVNLLLEQEGIDDTLRDGKGKTCRDVAKNREVLKIIDDSHSFLNATYRSLLHSYILSSAYEAPSPALLNILKSPRVRFVNLSYLDDDTGQSLLHEAAKRKDLSLIQLVVQAGADIFVRNRRGKPADDKSGTDEKIRIYLRQCANHDTTLIESPISEPPSLRGYLNKYTNVARGYNTRWFVLHNAVLSYFRHQEEETIASRGSISMKTAVIKFSSDRLRFEVQSTPSRGHHSVQKWYMKANHPVEASRWTQAIRKSIEWSRRESDIVTDGEADVKSRLSYDSEFFSGPVSASVRSQSSRLTTTGLNRKTSDRDSISSSFVGVGEDAFHSPVIQGVIGDSFDNVAEEIYGRVQSNAEWEEIRGDASSADTGVKDPPHETEFDLQGNSTAAQMELTIEMLGSLLSLTARASTESRKQQELTTAVKDSFAMVQGMLNEHVEMAKERETWYKRRLEEERGRQRFWEESLAMVVREGETLEQELRNRSRKRGSRTFGWTDTIRKGTLSPPPSGGNPEAGPEFFRVTERSETVESVETIAVVPPTPRPTVTEPEEIDTDEEDEFFDAIETGTLPDLVVPEELITPSRNLLGLVDSVEYEAYKNLRMTLEWCEERPNISLWGVLKQSIGKDLTKISLPVFFNEPTSMLQRLAEDMEFSECLDAASQQNDPLRRIAFVAAFAVSNYSSTIGRIAKPFNPMLSETFEYVRFDKQYRYISEQVSHHPPVSACWAEAPLWNYFGEVDTKNKFMGKSFDIQPTGTAHVELIIPESFSPGSPRAPVNYGKGKVVEHYSWKKVTTSISGFILGAPTIDHYGDMVITNHRTKDQCTLTFKPRGWRGKDAYEIAGHVVDSMGRVTYDIAGRWNSQLIASAASDNPSRLSLDPDLEVPVNQYTSSTQASRFLLWRNSEKPSGSPFNLTPFAITLNDCPSSLRPYLCPTDCRLRPDQRAFEMGRYEWAGDLKREQEEKQRAIRRAREDGSLGEHHPRWFRAETDGDTGERVWLPLRVGDALEYWVERDRIRPDGEEAWKNVDDIFIDQPEGLQL